MTEAGFFAQLIGTVELLEEDEKAMVKGLIINKFRGDKTILDPGVEMLEREAAFLLWVLLRILISR